MNTKNFVLVKNTVPFYITETIFNSLSQFIYSDTKQRIKIGDEAAWILKTLDPPQVLDGGGICKQQLMLVKWDEYKNNE